MKHLPLSIRRDEQGEQRGRTMRTNDCIHCGGQKEVCYVDQGLGGLLVKSEKGKKLFSNKKHARINPVVCTDCGFVEWYADEPENLK